MVWAQSASKWLSRLTIVNQWSESDVMWGVCVGVIYFYLRSSSWCCCFTEFWRVRIWLWIDSESFLLSVFLSSERWDAFLWLCSSSRLILCSSVFLSVLSEPFSPHTLSQTVSRSSPSLDLLDVDVSFRSWEVLTWLSERLHFKVSLLFSTALFNNKSLKTWTILSCCSAPVAWVWMEVRVDAETALFLMVKTENQENSVQ